MARKKTHEVPMSKEQADDIRKTLNEMREPKVTFRDPLKFYHSSGVGNSELHMTREAVHVLMDAAAKLERLIEPLCSEWYRIDFRSKEEE